MALTGPSGRPGQALRRMVQAVQLVVKAPQMVFYFHNILSALKLYCLKSFFVSVSYVNAVIGMYIAFCSCSVWLARFGRTYELCDGSEQKSR